MAVNPLSTPLKTEYKPLGLEAFAQPLSDMQSKFDTVQGQIDDATYTLSRLPKDDPRAKELMQELESKTNQLAQNLMTTGNYKQAASKLKLLNETFNKDTETNAIRSNYDAYVKAAEEHKKLVDGEKITQRQYDLWDYNVTNKYQGVNYDRNTGKYTSLNTDPTIHNQEEKILEHAEKLANMASEQGAEEWRNLGMSDAFTQNWEKTKNTWVERGQLTQEIAKMLSQSSLYKEWIDQTADREFYMQNNEASKTNNPNSFKDQIIERTASQLEQEKAYYEKLVGETSGDNKKFVQEQLKNVENNLQQLGSQYEQALKNGTYDDFAKSLYKQDASNWLGRVSEAAADIKDFNKQGSERTSKTDEAAKAKVATKVKKYEEVGEIKTNVVGSTGAAGTQIMTGQSVSSQEQNAIVGMKKDILTTMWGNKNKIEKDYGLGWDTIPTEAKSAMIADSDVNTLVNFKNNYTTAIQTAEDKTKDLQDQLKSNISEDKKKEIKAEIVTINENKIESQIAYSDQIKTLDNFINSEVDQFNDPEIKQLKKENPDPVVFLEKLKTLKGNTNIPLNTGPGGYVWSSGPKSNYTSFLENTLSEYKKHLKLNGDFALAQEVIMDKQYSAFTNKESDRVTADFVEENAKGGSRVKKMASMNPLTGETKEDPNGNKYDLGVYNMDTPHYAGVDQNGNQIFRYAIKSEYADNNKNSSGAVANWIKSKTTQTPNGKKTPPSQAEIKAWRDANPNDLYITVEGTNYDIPRKAAENYADFVEAGFALGGDDGAEMVTRSMQNFATTWLISDNTRREAYNKAAADLADGMKNNKYKTRTEAPAYWNPNGDGTSTGYMINYETNSKGELSANVFKVKKNDSGNMIGEPVQVARESFENSANNLPTSMMMMSLKYGTGRDTDLVKVPKGFGEEIFVPAFKNPTMLFGNQ